MRYQTIILSGFLLIVIGITLLSLLGEDSEAGTITVAKDGSGDYDSIQAAVDAAEPGDSVIVYDGIYDENVVVNKTINFIGNGSAKTIIDGGDTEDVVYIEANWVNMIGFGITGGGEGYDASGIKIVSTNVQVTSCHCYGNYKSGITLDYSDGNTLTQNTLNGNGNYGILADNSENNTFQRNHCYSNQNGIFLFESHNNALSLNNCSGNENTGIRVEYSRGNSIENNTMLGMQVYGMVIESSDSNSIVYNTVGIGNQYGILLMDCSMNLIDHNIISRISNIGILMEEADNITITRNTITDNPIGIENRMDSWDNVAQYNEIMNNELYGIMVGAADPPVTIDAKRNWWGSNTGPYHDTNNPDGTGDEISDYVLFDPWIRKEILEAEIVSITPNPAGAGESIQFVGQGKGNGTIVRYIWTSDIDGEFYNGTEATITMVDLSIGDHYITLRVQNDTGAWSTVNGTMLSIQEFIPNHPPIVAITSPQNSAQVEAGNVKIKGTVDDYDGVETVGCVEIALVREWEYIWYDAACSEGQWQYTLDLSDELGERSIMVRAWDGEAYSEIEMVDITVVEGGGDDDDDGGVYSFSYSLCCLLLLIFFAFGTIGYMNYVNQQKMAEEIAKVQK